MLGSLVDRAVDYRLVDHPGFDAPVGGDLLVLAILDQMLECLLERLRQRRALGNGPAVWRGVSDLTGRFELAVALLDGVRGDRRISGYRIGLTEHHRVGGR